MDNMPDLQPEHLKPREFSKVEIAEIAQDAATRALASFFDVLDIDLSDKGNVRKLRENLAFLNEQREGAEKLKGVVKKSAYAIMGSAFLGGVYWAWDIFKDGLSLFIRAKTGGP